jgi:hypothetical protein
VEPVAADAAAVAKAFLKGRTEGAAYVLTNERQLVPMWKIIFYGGQTLERHRALYEAQRPYLDSRTKKLIKQAIELFGGKVTFVQARKPAEK